MKVDWKGRKVRIHNLYQLHTPINNIIISVVTAF